uniref:poly(ADP-ribose) glycohydrolase n=1 Tax=Ditylenchus dipsaci TaxID=166011 RepID=A0A915ETV3_9BILA
MAVLARSLHELITQPIPLLKIGCEGSVTLSQQQIACLLANAFFCTFAEELRNDASGNGYNFINFTRIFSLRCQKSVEKLKCLLHYFSEVIKKMPCGNVTVMRNCAKQRKYRKGWQWHVTSRFRKQVYRGGVLGHGCVQEEIRFLICPEMIISCLICERMKSFESIRIIGAEMYSDYTGYGDSFQWVSHERDLNCPRDEYGRFLCEVVAIDALHYRSKAMQYNRGYIRREINKAYAGFSVSTRQSNPDGWPIATGNWGCGAFRGDVQLKSMAQLLASSVVERKLYYYTFGDARLAAELNEMAGILRINEVSVSQLYQILEQYAFFEARSNMPLFDYIKSKVLKDHRSTDGKLEKSKSGLLAYYPLFSRRPADVATSSTNDSAYKEFAAASKESNLTKPDVV